VIKGLRRRLAMLEDKIRIQDCIAQARILAEATIDEMMQKDIANFIVRAEAKLELLQTDSEEHRPFTILPAVKMHIGEWWLDPADGCLTRQIFQA
jgi:hypothetical protein